MGWVGIFEMCKKYPTVKPYVFVYKNEQKGALPNSFYKGQYNPDIKINY